jgi:hypothetical protein
METRRKKGWEKKKKQKRDLYRIPINRIEFRAFWRISLLNGRVPTDSNHQINGVVDGHDVANELWVDFESADETFANSRDESCEK